MKKKVLAILAIIFASTLAGCGLSSSKQMSYAPAVEESEGVFFDNSFSTGYTGGDYSSTTIDSDKADYSYNFAAEGDTYKNKESMLKDYEAVQALVIEKEGYIDSVNNSYDYYTDDNIRYNNRAREYKAEGCLNFTIQVKNESVPEVIDYLEQICQTNGFTVTNYTQRIRNYRSWKVIDEYGEYDNSNVITKEELDERLKYADIVVNMRYRIPRSRAMYALLSIGAECRSFWETVKGVVTAFLAIAVGLAILYAQAILFYKGFVKMIYYHKQKHPRYYPPKEVQVTGNSTELDMEDDE